MPDITPKPLPPCRLYVTLAREAPVAVIFRRGPSRRVQIIHWNTGTDTFTPGQWFHGHIYERRARLSADGTLLMYDTMKINKRTQQDNEYGSSWTAISKPPYLTALALWASGTSSGSVRSGDTDWFSHWNRADKPQPSSWPQTDTDRNNVISLTAGFIPRLTRDGWKQTQPWQGEFIESALGAAFKERASAGLPTDIEWIRSLDSALYQGPSSRYVTHVPSIHEKPHPRQGVTLVMTATLSGFEEKYRYSVRQGDGEMIPLTGAEWADWDTRGRLVFAQDGRIFAPAADAIRQDPPRELIDLNGNQPKPMVAPDWAKQW